MAVSTTVKGFLEDHGVPFDLVYHPRTYTSHDSAVRAHIPEDQMAKGVLLKDTQGYLEAVLPADTEVRLEALAAQLGRHLTLAGEAEAEHLYPDCELGAIPALGQAFGVETVVDQRLLEVPHVYFEAGDHEHLVHLHGGSYRELNAGLVHGHFGRPH